MSGGAWISVDEEMPSVFEAVWWLMPGEAKNRFGCLALANFCEATHWMRGDPPE